VTAAAIMPPEFLMPVAEIDDYIWQGYSNEAIEAQWSGGLPLQTPLLWAPLQTFP
jgi:hypothetical protein